MATRKKTNSTATSSTTKTAKAATDKTASRKAPASRGGDTSARASATASPSTARRRSARAPSAVVEAAAAGIAAVETAGGAPTDAVSETIASIDKGVSPEVRHLRICEAAYFIAERRGFSGGDPVADWLAAEQQVDASEERAAN